jgi:aminoglycoside phosphotransferase (APT) family kinase protein
MVIILYCVEESPADALWWLLSIDFVEGSFFKDAALSSVHSPEMRNKMYFSLFDTLARIHSVDVDHIGLSK